MENLKYETCEHNWELDKTKIFGQYLCDKAGNILNEKENEVMICKKCNSMKINDGV